MKGLKQTCNKPCFDTRDAELTVLDFSLKSLHHKGDLTDQLWDTRSIDLKRVHLHKGNGDEQRARKKALFSIANARRYDLHPIILLLRNSVNKPIKRLTYIHNVKKCIIFQLIFTHVSHLKNKKMFILFYFLFSLLQNRCPRKGLKRIAGKSMSFCSIHYLSTLLTKYI